MFLAGVTCLKHPGFMEEREWRAIHNPLLFPTNLIQPSTEILAGVPQVVYNLPMDRTLDPALDDLDFPKIFCRLIIGPTPYPVTIYDAFNEALAQAGVADAGGKIVSSDIPIRPY